MNWDTRRQTVLSKNYSSSSLTVKSVRRFTTKEQEDLTKPRMNNKSLWPYWVEFTENITQENSSHPDKTLFIFKNTYHYKEEKDSNPTANKEDVFYYFAHHLDKKSIAIPFSKFYYNNISDREGRLRFYCLSDSSDFSSDEEKKDVNKIITDEKTLWDKFKYTGEGDLVGENKKWVDASVYQEYQKAFSGTNLADKPAEVKKWQDDKDKTKLNSSEAATAYGNGWLSAEVKEKKGSLDEKNYLYDNVLTLKKDKIQEAENQLNSKLQTASQATSENRESIIKDLEGLSTTWTSNEQKAVLSNNQQKINAAVEKLKQDQGQGGQNGQTQQQQKTNAIQTIENHWSQNKDNNGKINDKDIGQVLGSSWKDNFNSLTTAEEIKKEQDKLISLINQAKEEEKIKNEKNNALATNPNTNQKWEPDLTEGEKGVINDTNLTTAGSVKEAGILLAHLRAVRNDKENGGPDKELTDWDAVEKVNDAIKNYQNNYFQKIKPYQSALESSDMGKAWKANNKNLNNVAENVYNRYWSLICNISGHQGLVKKIEDLQGQIEWLKQEVYGNEVQEETRIEAKIQQPTLLQGVKK